ncbi:MAG: elongation factor G [Gemmatimonadetes bacterium]|nr:elongation factor G [Gemmatimonadota bacterium]MXY83456.1 elongation factor G [Gemmatimonadota bacterium]MYB71268.1 elongation factor G [Gemmatimonadota bacterium]
MSEQTRNFSLCGHSGAGKTALSEAMLFNMGVVNRLGRIDDGTTTSDYDSAEIERQISLKVSLLNGQWQDHHLNIIDTPGYADFISEAKAALRVSDAMVTVVDSVTGIEIGTERTWNFAADYNLPRVLFINKMDRADADADQVLEMLQERFGRQVVPLQMAVNPGEGFNQIVDLVAMRAYAYQDGKATEGDIPDEVQSRAEELREQLVESIAETDEELMEKYFSEGELTTEDIVAGLRQAVLGREIFPVFFGDAYNNVGIDRLLDALVQYGPSPVEAAGLRFQDGEEQEVELEGTATAPLAALVFKTLAEQHVGELSLLRLFSGAIKPGDEVANSSKRTAERIGQIYHLNGNKRTEVASAEAGDIVALVKLKNTHTTDTLCAKGASLQLPGIAFPEPLIRVAIHAKEQGGEDRVSTGIAQLHEEDPSFIMKYDGEVRQTILLTQGELHLETIVSRLKGRFGVEIEMEVPRIPYRETIRGNADAQYRHKKQSGGRGQFGEVFIRIAPKGRGEGFKFLNEVVGGNIPSNFIPAVEKGVVETLSEGPVAGYQVIDVAVTVYDGKHHPVDSDEVSFKLAGSHAFKDAFIKAKPVLLEPIYQLEITVPEEFMGDVMGDLSSRRGRISGMDADGHFQVIHAEAPLAEIDRYATLLRSMTQGKGFHAQRFDRYEEVPGDIMAKVIENSQKNKGKEAA